MFRHFRSARARWSALAFAMMFSVSLAVGALSSLPVESASAQTNLVPAGQQAVSQVCSSCHADVYDHWKTTLHAQAYSSPIFQKDWKDNNSRAACLECHTSGFNPVTGLYVEQGVTCVACHGTYQPGHPETPMPVKPDADLCSTCHKTTTDEWRASRHGQMGIDCQACHDPHAQTPKAESVTVLCSNCHRDPGNSFTHSSHANAGLECSNCHMYTAPRTMSPIGGLVATGHTFSVGSDACIGCHQDTVHTRDNLVRLTGELQEAEVVTIESLKQQVQQQQQTIDRLETTSTVRLYTGLVQGALVGLITGGVAAWVVSRRIRVVEVGDGK